MNEKEIIPLIKNALQLAEKGLVAKATTQMRTIFNAVTIDNTLLWNDARIADLGKLFLVMYHFDIFDSEEENITLAHKALLYTMRAEELIESTDDSLFDILKNQAIILKSSQDCFVDLVSVFYQDHKREQTDDSLRGSRSLAQRVLPYVLYHVLIQITDRFDGFRGDHFLEDCCNDIEEEFPNISEKLMKEAANIKRLVYLQLKATQ